MCGQSLTAHKTTSGLSLAATPDARGPMNHHHPDPGNGIGEDRPMNHHYPNPGNDAEDRTKHSVNQIIEDRAVRAFAKTEHKNDLSVERDLRRATFRPCMALEAGRRSETEPETVISEPETVRPCMALEAGRRDNSGLETTNMRPETVEQTFLTSDRGTASKTVYAIVERFAVLKHVAEKLLSA